MIIYASNIYLPGMSFRQRSATRDASAQDKGHKQFNFTLQPLVGMGQNIRDMIQPEESQSLEEISKTLVSDKILAIPTSYEERHRPKRKAPMAPAPSAKFVSSSREFNFGRDENANHNVRSTSSLSHINQYSRSPKCFNLTKPFKIQIL